MRRISVKNTSELRKMRRAGRVVAKALRLVKEEARPGVSTAELDRHVEELIADNNASPAFKGYRGFPCTMCASINEQVVHGIPGNRKLEDGDLLSADIGAFVEDYAGDAAITVEVGRCTETAERLCKTTHEALSAAIDSVEAGVPVRTLSQAIQDVVEDAGYSAVEKYTGHGIGKNIHEAPQVPNTAQGNPERYSPRLPKGAVVAIEPMVNVGTEKTRVLNDGWTVVTRDKSFSAHFEHTVAVTAGGGEVLTCL